MASFPGVGHVALTVSGSDLEVSAVWYGRLFDADPVLDEDLGAFHHVVSSVGDTLVGLRRHPTTLPDDPFDEQ